MIKALGFYKVSLFLSLYITQFVGFAFFVEAFVGILRKNDIGLESLGLIYSLGLVWVVRFLWAPLVDGLKLSQKSHFKAWVGFFQLLMVLTLLIVSSFNIEQNIELIVFIIALFSIFSASQDVALDALVLKDISLQNRPYVMSLKSAGGMLGMVLGGGLGLVIYDFLGWSYTMYLLSIITLNSLILLYFYEEKNIKTKMEKVKLKSYFSFWKTRLKWLGFIIFFPASGSCAYVLITPILVDLGWELSKIGFYIHIVGYSIGAFITLLASKLMKKFNFRRVLISVSLAQFFVLYLYLIPLNFSPNEFYITAIVGLAFSLYGILGIVITTLMMDECKEISPATGFAMQHGVYMFFSIIFSSSSMALAGKVGYENVIILFSFFALIATFMATQLKIQRV